MNNNNQSQTSYSPEVRKNKGISPLWILPILTVVLAGWLVMKSIHDAGQRVQIYFSDAAGLVAGRTTIRYQGLEVGMVRDITLSKDLSNIYVDADIYPEAKKLLSKGTRFWLVKPTASLSGISGLDALVSGNYIAIHPSETKEEPETVFHALESSPSDLLASEGLNISLTTKELGGVSIGSQIVYRKIPIGEVYNYQLNDNAKSVTIQAAIKDEYSHIITDQSRFWNVSGLGASIGFSGVDVRLESLSALLGGSIAVDSPGEGQPVEMNTKFKLYPDLKTAGRGISIQIAVPDDNKISATGAPIMYRGIEIGQITNLSLSEGREHVIASAAIQPAFSDFLNSGSKFVLEEAELSLTGMKNIANLVTGNFLTLVPGEGDKARKFTAIRKNEFSQEQEKSVSIRLTSNNSFGLDVGTQLLYKGIAVGSIINVGLVEGVGTGSDKHEVFMDALIDNEYSHLIKSHNRFFVTGSATAELTESGLSVTVPPAKQLLSGSISFVSEGKNQSRTHYQLFKSKSLAEIAKFNQTGSKTLSLFASELPSISKGSPLLYRNLQVGSISDFQLADGGVRIKVTIENRYTHLINKHTVFWNRSGVEVDASLAGISIKAAPVKTLIQGGIAFDSLPGIDNKLGDVWKLYNDSKSARKFGRAITITSAGDQEVSKGTTIKYQGVTVGEVTLVIPNFNKGGIEITARILPEYVDKIAVANSHFWLAEPEIGLNGIKNVSALISKYINVEPGQGERKTKFKLSKGPVQPEGKIFQLQSETRGSVSEGTPILFRELEIGTVIDVQLGEFADRIISTIQIKPEFAYLIRANSVFWNVSGVDVSIGLTGANIKAGTVDSLIRGGITFSTPPTNELQPLASEDQSFYLYPQAEDEWKSWRTAIPKP
ncbi:MlaD family protein [Vibrio cyclitrophicus 1F53]|uniref:MlaD family protein n=1 Tax=Vibrio cyclitrophicus TaxID=47951 RepID=UPI0002E5E344|nr:MlaD family protein [Vibrio cyclitrophicus]OEF32031.1 paraquat-inducible protein B [Vibrio cyclitrophicus 1F53]OEF66443.1 paraquat-inducible protein B [Vibrio cyclitrophicus 1F175]PMH30944.1 paraquat-inducible protein B [Vibrio cyclitrophicus]PMH88137.1 paraquat-inducible protein B [Vibrio cyclitrophicus]